MICRRVMDHAQKLLDACPERQTSKRTLTNVDAPQDRDDEASCDL